MPHDACILTTKDLTILEVMLDRCLDASDPMKDLLGRKIGAATVVFREDVPPDVATLSSRITFCVDGRETDSRILSHDRMTSPIGLFLPITTRRGLALLGLSEGQTFGFSNQEGAEEQVLLKAVLYQPEAAKREREALSGSMPVTRAGLRIVGGTDHAPATGIRNPFAYSGGADDPGPSAA